jgi:hypothetical protein
MIIDKSISFHNSEGWIGLGLLHILYKILVVSLICWDILLVVKEFSTQQNADIFKYWAFYSLVESLRMLSISNVYPASLDNLSANCMKFGCGCWGLFSSFLIYFSSFKPFVIYS